MDISQKGKAIRLHSYFQNSEPFQPSPKSALRPSQTFSEFFVRFGGVDLFLMLHSPTCETRIEPLSQISDRIFLSENFRISISIPSAHLREIVKDGMGNLKIKKQRFIQCSRITFCEILIRIHLLRLFWAALTFRNCAMGRFPAYFKAHFPQFLYWPFKFPFRY
jgi:hypothetical protein